MPTLTVIGAGTTGLVTAISAAERGWDVSIFESRPTLGGRARTSRGAYRANVGPHAIYIDGVFWSWLHERDLQPAIVAPGNTVYRTGGVVAATPPDGLGDLLRALPHDAPSDCSFRHWLIELGADPEREDDYWHANALGWAEYFRKPEVVTYLRKRQP